MRDLRLVSTHLARSFALMCIALMCVIGGGCRIKSDDAELGTTRAALGPIPDASQCNYGVGKNKCLNVEPVTRPNTLVDGVLMQNEYLAATEVGFSNLGVPGSGRLFFTIDVSRKFLRIYAKDMPIPAGASRVAVLLDFSRFNATSNYVTTGDFGFEYDIDSKVKRTLVPTGTGASTRWATTSSTSVPAFTVRHGNLRGTSTSVPRRVDIEMRIDVSGQFGTTPDAMGIAIATSMVPSVTGAPGVGLGTFPEDIGALVSSQMWTVADSPLVQRANFQTLLVKPAPGNPISFMTWNVKRFTALMQRVEDLASVVSSELLDTSGIGDDQIATFIVDQNVDVVALQEVWRSKSALKIRDVANELRRARGLPEYTLVNSSDLAPSILGELAAQVSLRPDETHGGTYILSARTVMQSGYEVYTDCKGEDCVKAKGVVWARISTDPPSAYTACETGLPCREPTASGDHFIDVFATHLNAPTPYVCAVPLASALLSSVYGSLNGGWFTALTADNFHCLADSLTVRFAQVSQLSNFIDKVADKGRPSVVLGDLNLDGRSLSSPEYKGLLLRLKIQPLNGAVGSDDLNNWPLTFATDVDHGDLAREGGSNWRAEMEGTYIAKNWTASQPESTRFDYLFVRNPVDRNAMTEANTRYMMRRQPDDRRTTWSSPWPGPADRSSRLSDHKPILSQLDLAQYYVPGAYHPSWDHRLKFKVASYDTTGIDDCWGCDQLDVYTKLRLDKSVSGVTSNVSSRTTATCENKWLGIYGRDTCMDLWLTDTDRTATTSAHKLTLELWDDDVTTGDDKYEYIDNGNGTQFQLDWARGAVDIIDTNVGIVSNWMKFYDAAPQSKCTRSSRANICLRVELTENSPYP
jgi:endonuclease/exonuclease/phosphatase family metal-dependent hydrolase